MVRADRCSSSVCVVRLPMVVEDWCAQMLDDLPGSLTFCVCTTVRSGRFTPLLGAGAGRRVRLVWDVEEVVVKFSMEGDALSTLGRKTSTESDDLGALVRRLYDAAAPLEGTFNGPAKAAFDSFKDRVDDVATVLNNALVGITGSIAAQSTAFVTAADEGADVHSSVAGSQDFATVEAVGRFGPR